MDTGSSIWFLGIPVIAIMTVNLIFVINVIRVIKRKRGLQTENRFDFKALILSKC